MVNRHAIELLGIVKVQGPRGRIIYAQFPDGPSDPESEFPTYPESATRGKLLYAWGEARNHPYNVFAADVFASSLIHSDKYAWFGFEEDERPAIMEAFLNVVNTLRIRKRNMDRALATTQEAVSAQVAKAREVAKNERRRRVSHVLHATE